MIHDERNRDDTAGLKLSALPDGGSNRVVGSVSNPRCLQKTVVDGFRNPGDKACVGFIVFF